MLEIEDRRAFTKELRIVRHTEVFPVVSRFPRDKCSGFVHGPRQHRTADHDSVICVFQPERLSRLLGTRIT